MLQKKKLWDRQSEGSLDKDCRQLSEVIIRITWGIVGQSYVIGLVHDKKIGWFLFCAIDQATQEMYVSCDWSLQSVGEVR